MFHWILESRLTSHGYFLIESLTLGIPKAVFDCG